MDPPSAQSVGREFVRQYYTMLNEAPQYLHRFYSHNSSFVHGGVEKPGEEQIPAVGQAEIYKKIASLGFKDCHAKIRQVDSQASVEGSVVIQVVGELSNNGSVMRRFMQTFVLAPQSPKKYYLHNDIFRYQDEIFHDPIGSSPSEGDIADASETDYVEEAEVAQISAEREKNLSGYSEPAPTPSVDSHPSAVSNGDLYETASDMNQDYTASVNERVPTPAEPGPSEPMSAGTEPSEVGEGPESDVNMTGTGEVVENSSSMADQASNQSNAPTAKPTWAALAAMNTPVATPAAPAATSKPQATIRPEPKSEQRSPNGALPQRQPRSNPQLAENTQNTPVINVDQGSAKQGMENGRNSFGGPEDDVGRFQPRGGGGPMSQYPDSQQIFVGNVPHIVSDLELKDYFEGYGTVIDIRINRKTSQNLPNFGFVTFDSPQAVKNILNSMPLPKMHGKHRINVEEKKPREELAANRPRSGTRLSMPPGGGGGVGNPKPFGRESYSPRGGGRGGLGGSYPKGGRDNNTGRGGYNGVGGGFNNSGGPGRNYSGSTRTGGSSDDGRGGPPAPQR